MLMLRAGKKSSTVEDPLVEVDKSIDVEEITIEAADASNDSTSEWDPAGREEAVPILVSQVEDESDKRRSTFNFVLDEQDEESTNQGIADALELCNDSDHTLPEPRVDQDGTAQFTFRSPVKSAPVYEPYQFAENTAMSPKMEQDSTMQFLFRSPGKRASPIKHIHFPMLRRSSIGADEDGTIQMLFRSPDKRTSPSKRVQFDKESTPPPAIVDDTTYHKMPRSPVKNATPARHVQLAEEMSPTPVKTITPARHIELAEATSPSPSVEHDGTIQSLLSSSSKDPLPGNYMNLSEVANISPLPPAEGSDTLDSEMSDSVDEEYTAVASAIPAVSTALTAMTEDRADEESLLQETSAASQELAVPDQIEPEHNFEDFAMAAIDVPLEEEQYMEASADTSAAVNEHEDTEMSEIKFSIDLSVSPKKSVTLDEHEVEVVDEPREEENTITEASLQLEIGGDTDMAEEDEIRMSVEKEETEASVHLEELVAPSVEDNIVDEDDNTGGSVTRIDLETEKQKLQPVSESIADDMLVDIADGLTLGMSTPSSVTPKPRRLRSLSPPPQEETGPDDYTMTIALDDDTAILKDFLTRAAANKANKVETIARRTSLINRRDSGAVRHALASPRRILEDKDTNSPSKYDNDVTFDITQTLTVDADQHPPLSPNRNQADAEDNEDANESKSSRRSTRARKSRLPAPASVAASQPPQGPKSIAVRRADGTEPIVLKRTEAQELGLLTRSNTRKNKQGAFAVSVKLFSLNTEAAKNKAETMSDQVAKDAMEILPINPLTGKKNVRWDQTLAYFQEGTDTQANMKAEADSLATPDELSIPLSVPSTKSKIKVPKDKSSSSAPKIRRIRGLGAANGTPGKGLLGTESLLPDDVVNEEEVPAPAKEIQRLPKPKTSRVKKMPVASSSIDKSLAIPLSLTLPTVEAISTVVEATTESTKIPKERKSRLATPKRVTLPQPVSAMSVSVDGKENQQTSRLTAATSKKGIPVPQVIVPPAPVVETGLPRRRARKL
jgi:hypothetical protein